MCRDRQTLCGSCHPYRVSATDAYGSTWSLVSTLCRLLICLSLTRALGTRRLDGRCLPMSRCSRNANLTDSL